MLNSSYWLQMPGRELFLAVEPLPLMDHMPGKTSEPNKEVEKTLPHPVTTYRFDFGGTAPNFIHIYGGFRRSIAVLRPPVKRHARETLALLPATAMATLAASAILSGLSARLSILSSMFMFALGSLSLGLGLWASWQENENPGSAHGPRAPHA